MGRRLYAFTLIELLVVIAIIAILAAILFPVFAASKLAAKGAVSLTNVQQMTAGLQLYMGDYDGTVVPSGEWDDPVNYIATIQTHTVSTWPYLLVPYLKNAPETQDPLAPLNGSVLTGASDTVDDLFFPQFGMNYVYLTPFVPDPNNPSGPPVQIPVTLSMIDKPGETVFATSKYSYSESKLNNNGYPSLCSATLCPGAPAMWTTIEVPDCNSARAQPTNPLCFSNWGANDPYINDPSVIGLTTAQSGSNTGGVSLRNAGNMATVAFMDGHVRKMSAESLAAGTNWTPTIQANLVITTDPTAYLWDLQ